MPDQLPSAYPDRLVSELPLQFCPHCLTALRFKPGYAIDEDTKCPECAKPLLQTAGSPAAPVEKKPIAQPVSAPIPKYKPKPLLPGFLRSRVTAFFLLVFTATVFVLFAIVKPALDARTQALLHEMRQSNDDEPVISIIPPPSTTPAVVEMEPEPQSQIPETTPVAQSPAITPEMIPEPAPADAVAMTPPAPIEQPTPEPATPVKPPEPTPLERLEKALAIPVNRYAITEPITLQELLYDFEEMLNCSIHSDKLTENQREKLQQKIAPFELKETSLKGALERLLTEVGLTCQPTDEGQLHLSAQP
ncbi:hypothetical protein SH248x_001054 [Planctomycetaceae bacterium SH248]